MEATRFRTMRSSIDLSSHSGLALLGELFRAVDFKKTVDKVHLLRRPEPELRHGDVLGTMTALLFLGKPDYDAVKAFHDDTLLRKAMGLSRVPSSETLRNRLNLADGRFDDVIRELSGTLVRRFGKPTACYDQYVPLDIDVSPFDNSGSNKEGVSCTYAKVDGYAPIMAYIGTEGYLANLELREGKAHSQHGGEHFLDESIRLAQRMTDAPLLVRMDSGHDAIDNLKVCSERKVSWIIKRNLRRTPPATWLEIAKRFGTRCDSRPGKIVYRGELTVKRDKIPLRIVFETIERTTDKYGQYLIQPEIDSNTWWASTEFDVDTVIKLYHDHATSEQFHSELKTDMDLERLPSGKFATNALILLLGMFAYNALRLIGQHSLQFPAPHRKQTERRRIRSVLQDLVYMACQIVTHARKWFLQFGRNNRWRPTWQGIHATFS